MWNLLALGALSLTAVDVDVQVLSGEASRGNLVAISSEKLVVKTDSGDREIPLSDLLAVTPSKKLPPALAPAVEVLLVDGSRFGAVSYTVDGSTATVTLVGDQKLEIRTRSIHSVRWKSGDEAIDKQWQEIAAKKQPNDVVAIRKAKALDSFDGEISDVTAENVNFNFDDTPIKLPLTRVEGLVYFHPAGRELPSAICQVQDVDGSRWNVRNIELADEKLQLTSASGVRLELPLERLAKIDFSGGKILYLSDLDPDRMDYKPYFDSPATSESLAKLYRPRRDQSFDGGKLMLHGKAYSRGLALHSRTSLMYRLPDQFSRLLATVGVDDRVGDAGNVHLVISGDGKTLFEGDITGKDEQPLALNVDISGVRRLTILADYGDGLDFGDHLNLCDVRVKK